MIRKKEAITMARRKIYHMIRESPHGKGNTPYIRFILCCCLLNDLPSNLARCYNGTQQGIKQHNNFLSVLIHSPALSLCVCLFCSPLLAALPSSSMSTGLKSLAGVVAVEDVGQVDEAFFRCSCLLSGAVLFFGEDPRQWRCSGKALPDVGWERHPHCCCGTQLSRSGNRPEVTETPLFPVRSLFLLSFPVFPSFLAASFLVGHYIHITIRTIFSLCRLQKALSTGQSHIPRRAEGPSGSRDMLYRRSYVKM